MTAAGEGIRSRQAGLATVLVGGAAVALSLGLYARFHTPARKPALLFGFSGMLQMKTWVSTAALLFILVQLFTALWMWGRLPGLPSAPPSVTPVHRWSGSIGFTLTLPVAFHCIWSLGFSTVNLRVIVHSVAGCMFYGAYAAKMIGLRARGQPGWLVPVLGGTVFTLFLLVWLTTAVWFFTRTGIPLR